MEPAARPRPRRRRRLVLLLILGLAVAFPWIALRGFGEQIMRRQIEQRIAAGVDVGGMTGGWFEPLGLQRVVLRATREPDAEIVAEASEVRLSAGAFELLFGDDPLTLEIPEATLIPGWRDGSADLLRALRPTPTQETPEDGGREVRVRIAKGLLLELGEARSASFEANVTTDSSGASLQGQAALEEERGGRLELDFDVATPADGEPRLDALRFEARALDLAVLPLPEEAPFIGLTGRIRSANGSFLRGDGDSQLELSLQAVFEQLEGGAWRAPNAPAIEELRVVGQARLRPDSLLCSLFEISSRDLRILIDKPTGVAWQPDRVSGFLGLEFMVAEVADWQRPSFLPALPPEVTLSGDLSGELTLSDEFSRDGLKLNLADSPKGSMEIAIKADRLRYRGETLREVFLHGLLGENQFLVRRAEAQWFGGDLQFEGEWDKQTGLEGKWSARGLCGERALGELGSVLVAPLGGSGRIVTGAEGLELTGDLAGTGLQWQGAGRAADRGLFLSAVRVKVEASSAEAGADAALRRLEIMTDEADISLDFPAARAAPLAFEGRLRPAAIRSLFPGGPAPRAQGELRLSGQADFRVGASDRLPTGRCTFEAKGLEWQGMAIDRGRGLLVLLDGGLRLEGPAVFERGSGRVAVEAGWSGNEGVLSDLTIDAEAFPLSWSVEAPVPATLEAITSGSIEHRRDDRCAQWKLDLVDLELALAGERTSHARVRTSGRGRWTAAGRVIVEDIAVEGGKGLSLTAPLGVWDPTVPFPLRSLRAKGNLAAPWAGLAARLAGEKILRFGGDVILEADVAWSDARERPEGQVALSAGQIAYGPDVVQAPRLRAALREGKLTVDATGALDAGSVTLRGSLGIDAEALEAADRIDLVLDAVPWQWRQEGSTVGRAPPSDLVCRGHIDGQASLTGTPGEGWRLEGRLQGDGATLHRSVAGLPGVARSLPAWTLSLDLSAKRALDAWEIATADLSGEGLAMELGGRMAMDASGALRLGLVVAPPVVRALGLLWRDDLVPLDVESAVTLKGDLRRPRDGAWTGTLEASLDRFHLGGFPGQDLRIALRLDDAGVVSGEGGAALAEGRVTLLPTSRWHPTEGWSLAFRGREVALGVRAAGSAGFFVAPWLLDVSSSRPLALEGSIDFTGALRRAPGDAGFDGELTLRAGASRVVGSVVMERFARAVLGSDEALEGALRSQPPHDFAARLAIAARRGLEIDPFTVRWSLEDGVARPGSWKLVTRPDLALGLQGHVDLDGSWDLTLAPGAAVMQGGRDAPELRVSGNAWRRNAAGAFDLDWRLR